MHNFSNYIVLFSLLWFAAQGVAQPLVHIPDPSFLQYLKMRGYTTKDSLDVYKTWGKKKIDISGLKISNLEGLQFFVHLEELNCSRNRLIALKHLPATLKVINCSYNEIVVIKDLPKSLQVLNCSYNNIRAIRHVPATLKVLNCSNNNLKFLPEFPNGLKVLNYASNPIPESMLPYPYRIVPCLRADQNCIPNSVMDWNILHNNIDLADFSKIVSFRVTVMHQWRRGSVENAYDFRLKGKAFQLQRKVRKEVEDGETTYTYTKQKFEVNSADLNPILFAIQEQLLNIEVNTRYGPRKINLNDKINSVPVYKSSNPLTRNIIWFHFYTEDNAYQCFYEFDDSIMDGLELSPSTEPNDLKAILDWVYCYKLANVLLPPNEEILPFYFSEEQLEKILFLEKDMIVPY